MLDGGVRPPQIAREFSGVFRNTSGNRRPVVRTVRGARKSHTLVGSLQRHFLLLRPLKN
jgi:hypothetical protein